VKAIPLFALCAALIGCCRHGATPPPRDWDQSRSVTHRRIHAPEPVEALDFTGRVTRLLHEDPGDLILTGVGDMVFNRQISRLPDPAHRQLLRILQEADLAYGNLEFSMNDHPELRAGFYDFRAPPAFAWEVAAIGIDLVSVANNHALDYGNQGLVDCLLALDRAGISYAGAGPSLAAAHAPATLHAQGQKTRFALLSYLRFWNSRFDCDDPAGPCLAVIDPATVLAAREGGKVEAVEGPVERDVVAMEDDIVLAKRHNDVVIVALHNHDVSHHRAYGIQDRTPPNDEIMFRRAIDAGADVVFGSGPHVLRGIELYRGPASR